MEEKCIETIKNLCKKYEGNSYMLQRIDSHINTYLEADADLIKLLEKKVYHEETVSVIESIMNELKQRTWQLRDFISWEKFIGGQ
jgi:oligoribonuclease (3'-5' exoribonuclease)